MAADPFDGLFDTHGQRWNVDPDFMRALSIVESRGRDNAVSPRGARGRMQFMPATAAEYGVADPHDPHQAIPGATRKINDLLNQYGNPTHALMAYNAGAPSRWNNPETQAFPGKVAAEYQRLKAANKPSIPDTASDEEAFLNGQLGGPLPGQASADGPDTSADEADFLSGKIGGPLPQAVVTNADVLRRAGMGNQRVSAIPENDPVGQSLGKIVDPDRVPGAGTQAAVSMATDPEQQRRIMAAQLFPGMPLNDALSRLTYGDDGRMIAVDEKGNPFYVQPEAFLRGDQPLYRQNFRALGQSGFYGQAAGPALPIAGGVAGSAVASPTSLVLGPAAAAGGAAAGDAARQHLAGYFDPGRQPYDYGQTLREAALAGAGQGVTALGMRALAPNALMVPASDIRLAQTGNRLQAARDAYARAAAQGVDLTPGQASGLPSLLGYEDVAKNNPAFADRAAAFYQRQGAQLRGAGDAMLDTISPVADKTDAALMLQEGSGRAIENLRAQGNAAARSEFKAAEAAGNIMSPDLAALMDTPAVRDAMAKARVVYANKYGKPPEIPDFRLWQETKQILDDAYTAAGKNLDSSAGRSVASGIDAVRKRLIDRLDDAYPTYGKAREISAPGHAAAARLESAAAGDVAGGAGDETARSVFSRMFERQNARSIEQTRDAFLQAGRQDEWYAGVRGYIQDAIDKASRSQEGLNAASLRRGVWSNVDVRDNLRAALTPQQYAGFERFLTTAEDVARTYPINSLTALRQNAGASLQNAAANLPQNKLVRGIGMAFSPETLMRGAKTVTDPLDNYMRNRTVNAVVEKLFSADGLQMLEDMARMPPKSAQATSAMMQFMARSAPQLPAGNGASNPPPGQPANRLRLPAP